jgi:LmbE family N-acetylglucosaminyl deacetylase
MQWLKEVEGTVTVLAPHFDDEVIGCGGLIRRQVSAGRRVVVVYVTAATPERREEAVRAQKRLGISETYELGLRDGEVCATDAAIESVATYLTKNRSYALLVPAFEDIHPDHRNCHLLVASAFERAANGGAAYNLPKTVLTYEGFSPISSPNGWMDITGFAHDKWEALECFGSQQRLYRIRSVCESLNRYRALVAMRRSVQFAEAYQLLGAEDYTAKVKEQQS